MRPLIFAPLLILLSAAVAPAQTGTLNSWGYDLNGQVSSTPDGQDFVQVAGGGLHTVALREDGSIISWGWDIRGQVSGTPSGDGFQQVAGGSFHSLALGEPDPTLSVTNLVAGQVASIQVEACAPGGRVYVAYSLTGGGPTSSPYGTLLLSPPYNALNHRRANGAGIAIWNVPVPPGTTGVPVWLQAWDQTAGALSNSLALTVQ